MRMVMPQDVQSVLNGAATARPCSLELCTTREASLHCCQTKMPRRLVARNTLKGPDQQGIPLDFSIPSCVTCRCPISGPVPLALDGQYDDGDGDGDVYHTRLGGRSLDEMWRERDELLG